MRVKITPMGITGNTIYSHLPSNVETAHSNLLCNGNFSDYSGYLTPIIEWLQVEYSVGEFDRWYDSVCAPGETHLIFRNTAGNRIVTLY